MDVLNYIDINKDKISVDYLISKLKYVLDNEDYIVEITEHNKSYFNNNNNKKTIKEEIRYSVKYKSMLLVCAEDIEDDDSLIIGDIFKAQDYDNTLLSLVITTHKHNVFCYVDDNKTNTVLSNEEVKQIKKVIDYYE